jgi:hypothetical protein
VLLAAALAVFLGESWRIPPQYDDAYISYRYAANWLAGRGLVFNPGEYVEGYSNLLWTLLVAAGMGLGVPAKAVGHGLGLASGCAALCATYLYARRLTLPDSSLWAGLAAWILLASPAFARWSVSGMETPLFAAALVGALGAEASGRRGAATALAMLATLTRPEGALVAASLFGFRLLEDGPWTRRVWRDPLLYAGLWIGLTAFRLAYYGAPLPNTFYAKVGGVFLGISALVASLFLLGNGGLCALPALAAAVRERKAWPGAAFALVFGLYVVSIGGTPRYMTPLVPPLAALGAAGVAILGRRGGALAIGATAILLLTFPISFLGGALLRDHDLRSMLADAARTHGVERERAEDRTGEVLAEHQADVLRERGRPIASVAIGAIGAFGYLSGLPIVDIFGVVDPTVARGPRPARQARYSLPGHQRSNPDYVLSRKPDYILIASGEGPALPDWVPAFSDLRAHPDFARHYVWDAEVPGFRRVD